MRRLTRARQRGVGYRRIGRLIPDREIAIKIVVEGRCAQIIANVAGIAERAQRFATLTRAAISYREGMSQKPVPISLDGAAHWQQRAVDIAAATFDISHDVGKQREARRNVGCGDRYRRRRSKQRLLARRLDVITRRSVEAG